MTNNEKRRDLRISLNCMVCFLEVQSLHSSHSNETSYKQELICEISDISTNGIRIDIDHPLEQGAIHSFRIQFPETNSTFHLVGEIAWSKNSGADGPQAGILLIESDNTDIAEWKKQMASLMEDPDEFEND